MTPTAPRRRWFQFGPFTGDSLDSAELVAEMEQLGIHIPEEDAARIRTITDAINYFEARRGDPSSNA